MKRIKGKATAIKYGEIELDSKDELYFCWWLDELKEAGYIDSWVKCKGAYLLSTARKIGKGKTLRPHEYTPDFSIGWTEKARGIFVGEGCIFNNIHKDALIEPRSVVETKPAFDQNNMTRLFKLNQKWVYDKYHIYIDLIIFEKLISATFVPKRYISTDSGRGVRKLSKSAVSLDEYIQKYNEENLRKGIQTNSKR